jgi:hypothetical protein
LWLRGTLQTLQYNVAYPQIGSQFTHLAAQAAWTAALEAINDAKGFAIELFGSSSSDEKGTRKVPRIVIEPDRIMPSELGAPMDGVLLDNPLDNTTKIRQALPFRASVLTFDVHLVSASAAQLRIMTAVIAKALGTVKYVPYYDDTSDLFFVEQFNYYDEPDNLDGIDEKIYSYQAPDLYDVQADGVVISKMKEIEIDLTLMGPGSTLDDNLNRTGPSIDDGGIKVDNTGRHEL